MSAELARRIDALDKVEILAEKLGQAEGLLERGYAELAEALLVVQEQRYWDPDFESWGKYMEDITNKYKMGRAQLYHKLATVRELQGVVSAEELTEMGISKASVLADAHRANPDLPDSALAAAKDQKITARELKKALEVARILPEQESGEWYDCGFAFMVTAEEKATLQDAETAARNLDPVISNTLKTFQQKKEVALRWAQEFLSTYSAPSRASDEIIDVPYTEVEEAPF